MGSLKLTSEPRKISEDPAAVIREAAVGRDLVIAEPLQKSPIISEIERFAEKVSVTLPSGYHNYKNPRVIMTTMSDPVCDLIQIRSVGRRPDGDGYVMQDDTIKCLVLKYTDLDGRNGIAKLVDHGFRFYGNSSQTATLLRNWVNMPIVLRADRTGWLKTGDGTIYVRADGACLSAIADPVQPAIFIDPQPASAIIGGTFAGWQEQVARPALGNDTLVFGLCAAIAAPLLRAAGIETATFNFHSPKLAGKSLFLAVASSADRSPTTGARWSVSSETLQQLLDRTRDGMLALDALPENPSGKLLAHLTTLGDDGGYSQNDRDWRGITLSTAERPLTSLLLRNGKKVPASMMSRIIDVSVDTGIHELHGHPDVRAFIAAMRCGFDTHYGHLMPAFVQMVIDKHKEIESGLSRQIAESMAVIVDRAGIVDGDPEQRHSEALRRLALVAVAGELAIHSGLMPWPKNTALNAVCAVARRWNGSLSGDHGPADALCRLQAFLNQNGAAMNWTDKAASIVLPERSSGWQDKEYYYLTAGHIDAVTGLREAMPTLVDMGILAPGGQLNSLQFRMGRNIPGRPNLYRIRKDWSGVGPGG